MRRDSAWKRHFYEDLRSNNTDEKYSSEQHQFCDLRCSPEITDGIDGDCRDAYKNIAFHGNNLHGRRALFLHARPKFLSQKGGTK